LSELRGGYEVNATFCLDVATVGRGGGEQLVFGDFAGAEGDRDVETVTVVDRVADDFSGGETRGVFFEVGRELGVEFVAQTVAMGGEKIEGLVAIAQPPLAVGRFQGKARGLDQLERGGVGDVFTRGQGDGQKMFGAVDGERGR
jgi:hypothetical protein